MYIYFITNRISDLNGESILKEQSLTNLKKLTSILVVDDKEFSYLSALKKYEFNIVQKYDLTLLTDAEAFDVVLCDIRGVGKFLESPYDGANLIKELKLKYPSKTIIAYTANDYDAGFQEYLNYADKLIPKGSFAIEDWVSLLTQILKESADPVQQWKKTRKALSDAGVSTIDIAKYESQYVKAIKAGSFESIRRLYSDEKKCGSSIMIELLSSVVAKVIKQ